MISKACQYGIKSLIFMARHQRDKKLLPLKDIAIATNSPIAFTSKILQKLVGAGIISSFKGKGGGFRLEPHQYQNLTIGEVIEVIDGNGLHQACLLGFSKCSSSNPCPIHDRYLEIKEKFQSVLFSTRIFELQDSGAESLNLKG